MKKVITLAALVMAAVSITATTALASPNPVSTAKQACKASGTALVNVHWTYKTVDSGLAGNFWANETLKRSLLISKAADGSYCAVVTDSGTFVTTEGRSPGDTDDIPAGITGKVVGGYTTTPLVLTGTFNPNNLPTRGDLGIWEYTNPNRPSFASYGLTGDLADWNWSYQTQRNGSWVNASNPPGNSGDITG